MVEGVALESRDYLEYGEVITAELYISGSTLGLPARNSLEKHLFLPPFRKNRNRKLETRILERSKIDEIREWKNSLKLSFKIIILSIRIKLFIPIKKIQKSVGDRSTLEPKPFSNPRPPSLVQHMLLSKLNSVGAIFISWPEAADVIHGIARRESVAKGPTGEGKPTLLPQRPSFRLPLSSQQNMLRPRPPALRAMHAVV